jgi:hypothetical protein
MTEGLSEIYIKYPQKENLTAGVKRMSFEIHYHTGEECIPLAFDEGFDDLINEVSACRQSRTHRVAKIDAS